MCTLYRGVVLLSRVFFVIFCGQAFEKSAFATNQFVSVITLYHLMRRLTSFIIFALLATVICISSCKKQTETYQSDTLADYLPLEAGKYITYRLDSTVFLNFGKNEETHSYQVKLEVDAEVQDNLGRPAYRIYRYIRDAEGTQSWAPDNTFIITPLDNQVEYTEDNLRFITLHLPIKDGYTWKGNMYLPDEPYAALFDFQNDNNMQDWDYYYDGESASSVSVEDQTYNDVISVAYTETPDANLTDTIPMTDTLPSSRSYSMTKYSKNIGLVYREYVMWDHQPNPTVVDPGDPNDPVNHPPVYTYDPFTNGFVLRMWMIDHN